MQRHNFPNGGFVLHAVTIGASRYSAWFDADGSIHDAERKGRTSTCYPVKPGTPAWRQLAAIGQREPRS